MTKIEPMSIEYIKSLIQVLETAKKEHAGYLPWDQLQQARLILTWIEAEARARFWYTWTITSNPNSLVEKIAAVKREVGWPEDK